MKESEMKSVIPVESAYRIFGVKSRQNYSNSM